MDALCNMKEVNLVDIPKLSVLEISMAFAHVSALCMENAGLFEKNETLCEIRRKKREEEEERRMEEEQRLLMEERRRIESGIVLYPNDWEHLPLTLTSITVKSCDDYHSEVLDFSRFTELEELKIENKCFNKVRKVKMEGMKHLKRVEIGSECFTSTNAESELVVKDCSELSELVIGASSFPFFKSFQLSGLPQLKTISMRDNCFKEADFDIRKMDRLATIQLGAFCFTKSLHTTIEGD